MATIKKLMPYLEQGYSATDYIRIGPAYLTPKKQNESIVFEWTAYNMESEWAEPEIHTQEYVCTWRSSNWGILCADGSGSEYSEDDPEKINQVIADGRAYKSEGFEGE